MSRVVLHLCATCTANDDQRAALQTALTQANLPAEVRPQACFNACGQPSSLSLQGDKRATYFFTGIDLETDIPDIVATVQTYLAAPDGWIEDARPCGRLRQCLRGRVPALETE